MKEILLFISMCINFGLFAVWIKNDNIYSTESKLIVKSEETIQPGITKYHIKEADAASEGYASCFTYIAPSDTFEVGDTLTLF